MAAKNDSFMNWFGRQIGHVKKAVTADVRKKPAAAVPAAPKAAAPAPATPQPQQPAAAASPKVIYRDQTAEEIELPDRPGMKLRRTVIDEVIVEEKSEVRSEKRTEER